jgi:hypothetical protein
LGLVSYTTVPDAALSKTCAALLKTKKWKKSLSR